MVVMVMRYTRTDLVEKEVELIERCQPVFRTRG